MSSGSHSPPGAAQRFLNWFLRNDLAEEVQGDLEEQFYAHLEYKSPFRARANYWYQVLNYLRPFAISKATSTLSIQYAMFRNYFKISIRNLYKQKLYSAINIGGLTVGLASFILIFLYVQHEFSYDRSFDKANRIYRIFQRQQGNVYMGSDYFGVTPEPLAAALMEAYPEVSSATSIDNQSALLSIDNDKHYMETGLVVDTNFFDVFAFPYITGNAKDALENPNSIVLTRGLSLKLFGAQDPMGQTIIYRNKDAFTVTGIINDPPKNISFRFSFVVGNPVDTTQRENSPWMSNSAFTFFMLDEGASPGELQDKLPALLDKYRDADSYPFQDVYLVQELSKIHLQTNVNFDIGLKGNPRYVKLFSGIALIVLLLACANYMNLAVARSVCRVREVGLRKVLGAERRQLITQFLGESFLITFVALLLAIGLSYLLLPVFGRLIERPLELNFAENMVLLPGLLVLVVVVGFLSGFYPALFISSLSPFRVLKVKAERRLSGFKLQRWLILGQYVVTIVLVTGSIVINRQLKYMHQKEVGYDREHVIVVSIQDPVISQSYESIRNEWIQNPRIIELTASGSLPTNINSSTIINAEDHRNIDEGLMIYENRVHYNFIEVFGIDLVAGRDFSPEISSDREEGYLINETAARSLGWTPQEAIGSHFTHDGEETVIGVMRDFHMHSMHQPIQPLMLRLHDRYWRYISVKVRPEELAGTINMLEETMKEHSPYPFEYQFLDERFGQLYESEMKLGEILGFFTLLSILIGAVGIFGMAAFTTEQRTREIGIRKAMGASVRNIVILLSRDFIRLVVLSFVIAFPLAWYLIYRWLQDFAYRIEISWWIFVLAGLMVLLIAYLAIGKQSIKAALVNPVDTLGTE